MVDSFAVDLHLGTCFIDHYIRETFSGKQMFVLWYTRSVAINKSRNALVSSLEKTNEKKDSYSNVSVPVIVFNRVLNAFYTQQVMQPSTSFHGFLNITPTRDDEQFQGPASLPHVVLFPLFYNSHFYPQIELRSPTNKAPYSEEYCSNPWDP